MSSRAVAVIDSDAALAHHLVQELSAHGLKVEAFVDAAEVMARKDALPDLIVLCIDPKRTGWAVCNRLRKSATLKSTPLIITSAEATEKDFEDHKKLKTRAEEYLHKPFGVEALVEKVATLIGLPEQSAAHELEIPVESEEISVEDEGVVVEDESPAELGHSFATDDILGEGEEDRTRVGVVSIDGEVDLETDAAFAAIGVEHPGEAAAEAPQPPHAHHAKADESDPFALPDSPFDAEPLPSVEPTPMPQKTPSVDLDLGLDAVAQQAAQEPVRPRRASHPAILTSAPPPPIAAVSVPPPSPSAAHDTGAHDTTQSVIGELRRERDRLAREVDELKARPAPKAESAPTSGFSREREFLNLREIINKKEKEVLDLRDAVDAKDRQLLDGKDKLRELDRMRRDLDERALGTERELVAAKEKIEALSHDKERVLEREKQVKGRLEDALKTMSRYEEEIEGWKKKHADDVAALEQNYNDTVAAHESETQELRSRHQGQLEQKSEEHAAQLRETIDHHEQERTALGEKHDTERGRLEAEHARALAQVRESSANEREALRLRHESTFADQQQQHEGEVQTLRDKHAQTTSQLQGDHAASLKEKDQLHADELNGLRARHTTDTKALERRHGEESQKLHDNYRGELSAAEQRRQQELADRHTEHQGELEQLAAEHLREKQLLDSDHESAVNALDTRRQQELAAQAELHGQALRDREAQLEAQKVDELKQSRESHLRKVQALEESHADLKAGMQARHASQLDEIKNQHAATVGEFEKALAERDAIITSGQARIAELENALRTAEEHAGQLDRDLGETRARLSASVAETADRDQTIAERNRRIAELEQESAGYQDQILKAYQRIKSDESIVSRAKKALAIALTLLDESAADGSDEASS